jgi:hypothetical protein
MNSEYFSSFEKKHGTIEALGVGDAAEAVGSQLIQINNRFPSEFFLFLQRPVAMAQPQEC